MFFNIYDNEKHHQNSQKIVNNHEKIRLQLGNRNSSPKEVITKLR